MDMRSCSIYAGFDACDPLASVLQWSDRGPARVLRRRCRSEGIDRSPYEDVPLARSLPKEENNRLHRPQPNISEFIVNSTDVHLDRTNPRVENHGDHITMPTDASRFGSPTKLKYHNQFISPSRIRSPNRIRPLLVPNYTDEKFLPKLEEIFDKHDHEMVEVSVKQPLKSILNNPKTPTGILKKPKSKAHNDSKSSQEGRRRQRAASESDNLFCGVSISNAFAYDGRLGSTIKRIKDNSGTGYSYGTALALSNPTVKAYTSPKTVRHMPQKSTKQGANPPAQATGVAMPVQTVVIQQQMMHPPVMQVLRTTAINSNTVDVAPSSNHESPSKEAKYLESPVRDKSASTPTPSPVKKIPKPSKKKKIKSAKNERKTANKFSVLNGDLTHAENTSLLNPSVNHNFIQSRMETEVTRDHQIVSANTFKSPSVPTPDRAVDVSPSNHTMVAAAPVSRPAPAPTPTPAPTPAPAPAHCPAPARSHSPVSSSAHPPAPAAANSPAHAPVPALAPPPTSKPASQAITMARPAFAFPALPKATPKPQSSPAPLSKTSPALQGAQSTTTVSVLPLAQADAAPNVISPGRAELSAKVAPSAQVPPLEQVALAAKTAPSSAQAASLRPSSPRPAEALIALTKNAGDGNLDKAVTKPLTKLNGTTAKNAALKEKLTKEPYRHMIATLATTNPFKPISTRKDGPMNLPDSVSSCLRMSLFPRVPPYLKFVSHDETMPIRMHPAIQKHLKWKLTSITPIVVKKTLMNSGFKLVKSECDTSECPQEETVEWIGIWGKHMKSLTFRAIKDGQKMNHFPGTFQIGRKDRLWRNLQKLVNKFGMKEFGIMPKSYVLPHDMKLLKRDWEKYSEDNERWIIKPPASARGTGIKVVSRWTQIPKKKAVVVQKYVSKPLLINGNKFDMRLYVLVTSVHPLRIYMYKDGLARFASVKYNYEVESLGDRYMHLTNYSINRLSKNYTPNEDFSACEGHKWTLQSLFNYLETERKVNTKYLWETLKDLVIKTIIAGEASISSLTKANMQSRYNCYELFGVDVLLDEELKPWLLEVNISPSLHSASPLDLHVKGPLVTTTLNIAQFQVPVKTNLDLIAKEKPHKLNGLPFDSRLYTVYLSKEERDKHIIYTNMDDRDIYLRDILSTLTPDDVRHLIQAEDELTQAVDMERVFPTNKTHKYLGYLTGPRYYNRLFDAWETRYYDNRTPGIDLLRDLCDIGYHLEVPPVPLKNDVDAPSPPVTERASTSSGVSMEPAQSTTNVHVARVCGDTIPQTVLPSPLEPRA